jgi:hypothetical protein
LHPAAAHQGGQAVLKFWSRDGVVVTRVIGAVHRDTPAQIRRSVAALPG